MTRFTIGLLAAVLLAASAPAQDSAEVTIIKTAMEKSGTEANLKMFPAGKSEMKGKMTIDGAELPFTGSMTYSVPGKVRMSGFDFNYKQALTFLPSWARGVQVFANGSAQRATGAAADNFSGYIDRKSVV